MKRVSPHAAVRLQERYRGVVTEKALSRLVEQKQYWAHMKLTTSRTLCSGVLRWGLVYFVLSKRRGQVITALGRAHAKRMLESEGRPWPPRRGDRTVQYLVALVRGPDEGVWNFCALRQPDGDECYSFSVPSDIELTGDYILELAWEHAPDPSVIQDISLTQDLEKLFDSDD